MKNKELFKKLIEKAMFKIIKIWDLDKQDKYLFINLLKCSLNNLNNSFINKDNSNRDKAITLISRIMVKDRIETNNSFKK